MVSISRRNSGSNIEDEIDGFGWDFTTRRTRTYLIPVSAQRGLFSPCPLTRTMTSNKIRLPPFRLSRGRQHYGWLRVRELWSCQIPGYHFKCLPFPYTIIDFQYSRSLRWRPCLLKWPQTPIRNIASKTLIFQSRRRRIFASRVHYDWPRLKPSLKIASCWSTRIRPASKTPYTVI